MPSTRSQKCSVFFSICLIVSGFTFRSMIDFEVIIVYGARIQHYFFPYEYPVILPPFAERLLSPLYCLSTFESWLFRKDPDAEKDWGQEKGTEEDEMVGWHHWLNGHEFEQTLRDSEVQGSLACCSPWGSQRVGHDLMAEQQQKDYLHLMWLFTWLELSLSSCYFFSYLSHLLLFKWLF